MNQEVLAYHIVQATCTRLNIDSKKVFGSVRCWPRSRRAMLTSLYKRIASNGTFGATQWEIDQLTRQSTENQISQLWRWVGEEYTGRCNYGQFD